MPDAIDHGDDADVREELLADAMFDAPEKRGERLVIDRRYANARLKKVDAAALRE